MSSSIWPREVKMFEGYLAWRDSDRGVDLREAGYSTDFSTYSSALITKRLHTIFLHLFFFHFLFPDNIR